MEFTHEQRLKILAAYLRVKETGGGKIGQELFRYHVTVFQVSDRSYRAAFNLANGLPEDATPFQSAETVQKIAQEKNSSLDKLFEDSAPGAISKEMVLEKLVAAAGG